VDLATGEVVGLVREAEQPFRVDSRGAAEWILEMLLTAESETAALEVRKRVVIDNIESMQRDHERRAIWLRERFGPELEAWARSELEGKKQRTVKTPWGRLSFRRRKARLVVDDESKAIAWAVDNCAEAVKTTSKFLVSQVPDELMPDGCHVEPERDGFSIETGADV
jgi:hypothetical protein